MAVNSAKTAKSPFAGQKLKVEAASQLDKEASRCFFCCRCSAASHTLINAMFLSNGGVRATEAVLSVASLFLFSHMNKSPEV